MQPTKLDLELAKNSNVAPMSEQAFGEALTRVRGDISPGAGDARSLQHVLDLMDELDKRMAGAGTGKWFIPGTPYGIENCKKHRAFFDAGAEYKERIFLASNRTGKSIAGAYEMACHLTGEYPDWWIGVKFDRPVHAWAMGSTARSTRDIVQKELLGPIGNWGSGMIPREKMGRVWALQGTPQGIDVIEIRHKSGGMSTLGFKNYEQDIAAFYGTALDVIWLDEECPQDIYNESLMRTKTTPLVVIVRISDSL